VPINDEVRLLDKKWSAKTHWPNRLDWLEINGMRGWERQRIAFDFPVVAIVGENGSGKSTVLQAAACAYQSEPRTYFPTEFFPDTAWDKLRGITITYGYTVGAKSQLGSLRRRTTRWLGQTDRPLRSVRYEDLNRIQPVGARVGYARIAKVAHTEKSAKAFDQEKVKRLSFVMNQEYQSARMAITSADDEREVPVLNEAGIGDYSGYHQGSGQITVQELFKIDFPKYGLILIDEIESSLHPRAQRRLVRDLAEQARLHECQVILTTHSPYILEELPLAARICILRSSIGHTKIKEIVAGVSPEFAMTKMDDDVHPECDVYVEDEAARVMVEELLARHGERVIHRCAVIPYGAVHVGASLGQMLANDRFRRPTVVFLDGDSAPTKGCALLPGGDAPEQVVFKALHAKSWGDLWTRVGRDNGVVRDACTKAMTLDHHDWVRYASNDMRTSPEALWRAMCGEWAAELSVSDIQQVLKPILTALPS
jgi:predicted ATPase